MSSPCIVWFRRDLRLADHPALTAAVRRGGPVLPTFFWSPEEEAPWAPGAASCWWLHGSLAALEADLLQRQSRLVVRRGPVVPQLLELARASGAQAVYWTRCYDPSLRRQDDEVAAALRAAGLEVCLFPGSLLVEPSAVSTQAGNPFQVFTPFWKTCLAQLRPRRPLPAPDAFVAPAKWPAAHKLDDLGLLPRLDWAGGLRANWAPGEAGAQMALDEHCGSVLATYAEKRDFPGVVATSRLSPHLHFGEVTPQQIWWAVQDTLTRGVEPGVERSAEKFLSEVGWREFAHHLLFHFPQTPQQPLRENFAAFPWRDDPVALRAWQRGQTGYPIVDAGMRQLWATGWVHNRVRMIVASFLVKHLLLPWRAGAAWFWDTLVDADLANNTLGWQWTSGCGADAAPYFRIFNPTTQGEKFDAAGTYVRRWLPELARLPDTYLHRPWEASPIELTAAGVELGTTYPRPIVDHAMARQRALAALAWLKDRNPRSS